LHAIEEQKIIADRLDIYIKEIELAKIVVLESILNHVPQDEKRISNFFIEFLKTKLDYSESNLIKGYKIENSSIDLLIADHTKINISPFAIVEFKTGVEVFKQNIQRLKDFRNYFNQETLPCFLFNGIELFVLQSYGWQKISIVDFPKIDKLKQ
jgi:hypothetical protein